MQFKNKHISKLPDEEIIGIYKKSLDKEIIAILFKKYASFSLTICLKYLKNYEESKDAVLDVFEKLLDILLIHEISNFKSWLHSTLKNHCLGKLRSKVMYESMDNFSEDLFMENPEDSHLHEKELNYNKLNSCLEHLKMEQKKCVLLFYMQEKSYKEISTDTGYDIVSVKSYIQNGKRNLKICLEST